MKSTEPSGICESVAALARRLSDGDLTSLGPLFDCVAPRLLRYAETVTRNRDDAEDAVQAAMTRVAQHPGRLAAADHPWAYFLKVLRNEALRVISRRRPAKALDASLSVWTYDEGRLQREESRSHVREAVRRLPPEQFEVVVLKIWEGMTFHEIAVVLGESPNTAASRYRYALDKLSRYLRPVADEVLHD